MAEDARDRSTDSNTNPIATTKTTETTETPNTPPDPANPTKPKVTPNNYTAAQQATLSEAVKTIHAEDFKRVHLQPCVRNAFLYGIAAGFAFGGLKIVLRGLSLFPLISSKRKEEGRNLLIYFAAPVLNAANWAAGTFVGGSAVTYEVCQYRRQKEKAGMQRAVEIIDRRKAEREKALEKSREASRRAAEERAAKKEAERLESLKPWYKKIF